MPLWQTHKFGGSSLADAARIRKAAQLVTEANQTDSVRIAVIVSAMGGVTDKLIQATEWATDPEADYETTVEQLRSQALDTCTELLEDPAALHDVIETSVGELLDLLRGVRIAGTCPTSTHDLSSGIGETWSAQLLCNHLCESGVEASYLDTRQVLVVEQRSTGPAVLWNPTATKVEQWFAQQTAQIVVITGYIARAADGTATTLRRNGSDYSASIFGKLLSADSITIWTDVAGVMSADPRLVPEAKVVPTLSYDEAMELAYFGAAVLHPQTMGPAIEDRIPILIRNAGNPSDPGTAITDNCPSTQDPVKGFSSVAGISLLSLEGAGMIGVPGIAGRMFGSLREVDVSVIMISQASSEHSVCVAIPEHQGEVAREAVRDAFSAELDDGQVQSVNLSGPYNILAAVGDDMIHTPGVAARFFAALARAGINVRAIAQGASERNISVVVAEADAARALRAVHAGFYLAEQTISVALIGVGKVGSELLKQLLNQSAYLRSRFQIDLQIRAIANSSSMLLRQTGLDSDDDWRQCLQDEGTPFDQSSLLEHLQAPHLPHAVILDCSASPILSDSYSDWLARGIHVITPNKLANTGPLATYLQLQKLGNQVSSRYLYEATVGAGLPVISTIRHLLETGDKIERIEGILSGSLSFMLSEFGPDRPFSQVVREARQRGYTEPDPREDLSGMDVARKAVILGREIGLTLELQDLPVESLVPDGLDEDLAPDAFIDELAKHDSEMESRRLDARSKGQVLRYVACLDLVNGTVEVGLKSFDDASAFARIGGGDNILVFTTLRYTAPQPLIIQGPGAGAAVTAAGVFGDILTLANRLGSVQR
ncbi:MAG: bifunctional aspartate kinase/homoserine dehydrogenase I [Planctomycetota bacterium]|nr:bifunctional aspartate kinase/homoserine dehydrogenase I [Planctomycetota bacterium]